MTFPGPYTASSMGQGPVATQIGTGDQVQLQGPMYIVREGGSEVVLTSGSDLNRVAVGPWSAILDAATRILNSWRPNNLRDVAVVKTPANYGQRTSVADYAFRGRAFSGVANMADTVPAGNRPMWNNMDPIVWGLRVVDPKSQVQGMPGYQEIQVAPMSFTPATNASLTPTLL